MLDVCILPWFLYIVPLKQGLKPSYRKCIYIKSNVFIHSSIKTRIETRRGRQLVRLLSWFLYIVPLKQGLKLNLREKQGNIALVFIHSSIKTRIETIYSLGLLRD